MTPDQGRYGYCLVTDMPSPGHGGSAMSAQELQRCCVSDDERFSNAWPKGWQGWQMFSFQFPESEPDRDISFVLEGYYPTGLNLGIDLFVYTGSGPYEGWQVELETFSYGGPPDNIVSTSLSYPSWRDWLDENDRLWFLVKCGNWHIGDPAGTLYTDTAQIPTIYMNVAEDRNLFGQHYRVFHKEAAAHVMFERRDLPNGQWSDLIEAFSGEGRVDIECIATGALRAACIDSDGNLQKMISLDDGESWSAA